MGGWATVLRVALVAQLTPSLSLSFPPLPLQCYYLGATKDAATRMVSEVSRPLSSHIPVSKICEKLKKKDSQICDLRYGETHAHTDAHCEF